MIEYHSLANRATLRVPGGPFHSPYSEAGRKLLLQSTNAAVDSGLEAAAGWMIGSRVSSLFPLPRSFPP